MAILYGSLIFASVWLGVTFSRRLADRVKIYEDLVGFLATYEANLLFRQDNLGELIQKNVEDSSFKNLAISVVEEKPLVSPEFLSRREVCEINEMILALSVGGLNAEKITVDHIKFVANKRLELAIRQQKSYATMGVKISFWIGLLLVVLLI